MRATLHKHIYCCTGTDGGQSYTPTITPLLNVEQPQAQTIGIYKLVGTMKTRIMEDTPANQVGEEGAAPKRRRRRKE